MLPVFSSNKEDAQLLTILQQPLAEALSLSKQDAADRRHVRMQKVLTEAALAGSVPSTFLNLIGLLNLLDQHTMSNGTSASQLAATFASEFLPNRGSHLKQFSKEWREATQRATAVLTSLISNIYIMFPPQGAQQPPSASSPSKQSDAPSSGSLPTAETTNSQSKKDKQQQQQQQQQASPQAPGANAKSDAKTKSDSLPKESQVVGSTPNKGSGGLPHATPDAAAAHAQHHDASKAPTNNPVTPAADTGNWAVYTSSDAANHGSQREFDKDEDKKVVSMLFGDRQEAAASPVATTEEMAERRDEEASNVTGPMEEDGDEEEEDDGEAMDAVAIAKFSYTASDEDELSFKKGDVIKITWRSSWDEETQEGWYTGHINGRTGQLPSTYVQIQTDASANAADQTHAQGSQDKLAPGQDGDKQPSSHYASEEEEDLSVASAQSATHKSSPPPSSTNSLILPKEHAAAVSSPRALEKHTSSLTEPKASSPKHAPRADTSPRTFAHHGDEKPAPMGASAPTLYDSGDSHDSFAGADAAKKAADNDTVTKGLDKKHAHDEEDTKRITQNDSAKKGVKSTSPSHADNKSHTRAQANNASTASGNNKAASSRGWLDDDDDSDDHKDHPEVKVSSTVSSCSSSHPVKKTQPSSQQHQQSQQKSAPAKQQQSAKPSQPQQRKSSASPASQRPQSAPQDKREGARQVSQRAIRSTSRDHSPAAKTPVSHSKASKQSSLSLSVDFSSNRMYDDDSHARSPEDLFSEPSTSPNSRRNNSSSNNNTAEEDNRHKMELLFGKTGRKRGGAWDKATKEAWNEVLAWYKKSSGGGAGTSPGSSSRAYPDKILSKVKAADSSSSSNGKGRSSSAGPREGSRGRSPAHASPGTHAANKIVSTYHEPDRTGMTEKAIARRPWRQPPTSNASPKRGMPRAADPSQYAHSWKRKWHTRILHDGDVRTSMTNADEYVYVNHSEDEGRSPRDRDEHEYAQHVRHSMVGTIRALEGVGDHHHHHHQGSQLEKDLEKETQTALEKVHAIRSSQRMRMKMYNQALVSVSPPPQGTPSPISRQSLGRGSRARSADPPYASAREAGLSEHMNLLPQEEDEYKYWTGNAAYRHVERQRRARLMSELKNQWLPSGHRRKPPQNEIDPTYAKNPRHIIDGIVIDMSDVFRRAGTADNARRGVKATCTPALRHSVHMDRDIASEKFALLEAHLQHALTPQSAAAPGASSYASSSLAIGQQQHHHQGTANGILAAAVLQDQLQANGHGHHSMYGLFESHAPRNSAPPMGHHNNHHNNVSASSMGAGGYQPSYVSSTQFKGPPLKLPLQVPYGSSSGQGLEGLHRISPPSSHRLISARSSSNATSKYASSQSARASTTLLDSGVPPTSVLALASFSPIGPAGVPLHHHGNANQVSNNVGGSNGMMVNNNNNAARVSNGSSVLSRAGGASNTSAVISNAYHHHHNANAHMSHVPPGYDVPPPSSSSGRYDSSSGRYDNSVGSGAAPAYATNNNGNSITNPYSSVRHPSSYATTSPGGGGSAHAADPSSSSDAYTNSNNNAARTRPSTAKAGASSSSTTAHAAANPNNNPGMDSRSRPCSSAPRRPEPLLYAVALVGLPPGVQEHAHEGCGACMGGTRKDEGLLSGPLQPHLLAMHTPKTTDSQASVSLAGLICAFATPCGACIRSTSAPTMFYSTMLPRSGLPPLFLHCRLSYKREDGSSLASKYGTGGGGPVYVPECLVVASEAAFHETLSTALSLFSAENAETLSPTVPPAQGHGDDNDAVATATDNTAGTKNTKSASQRDSSAAAASHTSGVSMLETLASTLTCEVPPPRMPLYLQVGHTPVHCQRPDYRELPLADIDFAPLLRSLDARNVARLLTLLLCKEPQVVLISDNIDHLFPAACALIDLMYPFVWSHSFVPVLPPSLLSFLDSPHAYLLGVHRPCVPRGRIPSHVVVVDLTYNTVSVPAALSEATFDGVLTLLEARIHNCVQACVGADAKLSAKKQQRQQTATAEGVDVDGDAGLAGSNSPIMGSSIDSAAAAGGGGARAVTMHGSASEDSNNGGKQQQDASASRGQLNANRTSAHSSSSVAGGDKSVQGSHSSPGGGGGYGGGVGGMNGHHSHTDAVVDGSSVSTPGQHRSHDASQTSAAQLLPPHIHVPGAWGSSSTGGDAAMHTLVKNMRDGLASDLAMLLYRFPLFLHAPRQPFDDSSTDRLRKKHGHVGTGVGVEELGDGSYGSLGTRGAGMPLDGVTFDASSFAASADEDYHAFVRALCMTRVFTGVYVCVCVCVYVCVYRRIRDLCVFVRALLCA
jgi:hypothetical protein